MYKRKYRRTTKPSSTRSTGRRTYGRRKSVSGRSRRKGYTKVSRFGTPWKNPIPQQSMYKFTYHDTGFVLVTNTASSYQTNRRFRGNSLFDPDYTGAGVQPYGFDNYCGTNNPFGKYICYGSKITVYPHVYFPGPTTNAGWAMRMIVYPTLSTSNTYREYEDLCRIPYHSTCLIENSNDTSRNILKKYVSSRKMYPNSPRLEDEGFSALWNADPTNVWYWVIALDSSEFTIDTEVRVDVKIDYYVRLMKIDDINES